MTTTSKDLLSQLHEALTKQLLDRIESGEATAADFAAAAKFLKDNSITISPESNNDLDELQKRLDEKRERRKKLTRSELDEAGNVISIMGRQSS